jgi:hypothetical protein
VLPPRPLLALCLLLVGLLAWSVAARPAPGIPLADAARWEGQAVRVEGWASGVRQDDDGLRLTLTDGGHALQVHAPPMPPSDRPGLGDRVEAEGRITRWQGILRLEADDATALRTLGGPRPVQPSWHDLAAEPGHWAGIPIRLQGMVVGDRLLGDDGASLALGDGPWPESGPAQATGVLRFDPACVCHRLDVREARPWTR